MGILVQLEKNPRGLNRKLLFYFIEIELHQLNGPLPVALGPEESARKEAENTSGSQQHDDLRRNLLFSDLVPGDQSFLARVENPLARNVAFVLVMHGWRSPDLHSGDGRSDVGIKQEQGN